MAANANFDGSKYLVNRTFFFIVEHTDMVASLDDDEMYHVELAVYPLDDKGQICGAARVLRSWDRSVNVVGFDALKDEEKKKLPPEEGGQFMYLPGKGANFQAGAGERFRSIDPKGMKSTELPALVIADVGVEPDREYVAYARIHDAAQFGPWREVPQTRLDFVDEKENVIRDLPISRPRPLIDATIDNPYISRDNLRKGQRIVLKGLISDVVPIRKMWINGQDVTGQLRWVNNTLAEFRCQVPIQDSSQRIEIIVENALAARSHAVAIFNPIYSSDPAGKVTGFAAITNKFQQESKADLHPFYLRYFAVPYRLSEGTTKEGDDLCIPAEALVGAAKASAASPKLKAVKGRGPCLRHVRPPAQDEMTLTDQDAMDSLTKVIVSVGASDITRDRPQVYGAQSDKVDMVAPKLDIKPVVMQPDQWLWASGPLYVVPIAAGGSTIPANLGDLVQAFVNVVWRAGAAPTTGTPAQPGDDGYHPGGSSSGQTPGGACYWERVLTPMAAAAGARPRTPESGTVLDTVKNGDVLRFELFSIHGEPVVRQKIAPAHKHADDNMKKPPYSLVCQLLDENDQPKKPPELNRQSVGLVPDQPPELRFRLHNRDDARGDDDSHRDEWDVPVETVMPVHVFPLGQGQDDQQNIANGPARYTDTGGLTSDDAEKTPPPPGRLTQTLLTSDEVARLVTQEYYSREKREELDALGQLMGRQKIRRHQILPGGYLTMELLLRRPSEEDLSLFDSSVRTLEITKRWYVDMLPSPQPAICGSNPRVGAPGTQRTAGLTQHLDDGSVYVHSGELFQAAEDLLVKGTVLDLQFLRTYRSHSLFTSPAGKNWDYMGNVRLVEVPNGDVLLMNGQAGVELYKLKKDLPASLPKEPEGMTGAFNFKGLKSVSQYDSPVGAYRYLIRGTQVAMAGMPASATEPDRFYLVDKGGLVLTFVRDCRYPDLGWTKKELEYEDDQPAPGVKSQYLLTSIHHRVRTRHMKLIRDASGFLVAVIDDTPVFVAGHDGSFGRVTRFHNTARAASYDRFLYSINDFSGRTVRLSHPRGSWLEAVVGVTARRGSGGAASTTLGYTYSPSLGGPTCLLHRTLVSGKRFLTVDYDQFGRAINEHVDNAPEVPAGAAMDQLAQVQSDGAFGSFDFTFAYSSSNGDMKVTCYEDGPEHVYDVKAADGLRKVQSHAVTVEAPGAIAGGFVGVATTKFEYDGNGEVKTITWPKGNVSYFEYDSIGNLLKKGSKSSAAEVVSETTYGYDESLYSLPTSVVSDPYVKTKLKYDDDGNPKEQTEQSVQGVAGFADASTSTTKSHYTNEGLLDNSTDGRNVVTKYIYYVAEDDCVCGDAHHFAGELAVVNRLPTQHIINEKVLAKDWAAKWSPFGARVANAPRDKDIITTFLPNVLGDPATVVDACGNSHAYVYNELSLVLTDDRSIQRTYSRQDRVASVTVPSVTGAGGGRSEAQTAKTFYDAMGNVVAEENAGLVTATLYDVGGRPIASIDPAGYKSRFTYESRGLLTKEVHDVAGMAVTSAYAYDKNGNRVLHCNPENWWEGWTYDKADRLTHHMSTTGLITGLRYGRGSLVEQETQYAPLGLGLLTAAGSMMGAAADLRPALQAIARMMTMMPPPCGKVLSDVTYGYNDRGRVASESRLWSGTWWNFMGSHVDTQHIWSNDDQLLGNVLPEGVKVVHGLDSLNRMVSQKIGEAETTIVYDGMGRAQITKQGHTTLKQEYDAYGNALRTRDDALGADIVKAASYDASDNLIYKATAHQTEAYMFDAAGRLGSKQVATSGQYGGRCTTTYTWQHRPDGQLDSTLVAGSDGSSLLQEYRDYCFVGAKTTRMGGSDVERIQEFDKTGNKMRWADGNSTQFSAQYDGGGNLLRLEARSNSAVMHVRNLPRDVMGRPLQVQDKQHQHYRSDHVVSSNTPETGCDFEYDTLGNLVVEKQKIGGWQRQIRFQFSASGQRIQTSYPATGNACIATGSYGTVSDTGLKVDYAHDPVYGTRGVTCSGAGMPGGGARLVTNVGYDGQDFDLSIFNTGNTAQASSPAGLSSRMEGWVTDGNPTLPIKTHLFHPNGVVHPVQYVRQYRRLWGLDDDTRHHADLTRFIGININNMASSQKMTKREKSQFYTGIHVDGGPGTDEHTVTRTDEATGAWAADDETAAQWVNSETSSCSGKRTLKNAIGTVRGKENVTQNYGMVFHRSPVEKVGNTLTLDERQMPRQVDSRQDRIIGSQQVTTGLGDYSWPPQPDHVDNSNVVTRSRYLWRQRNGLVSEEPNVAIERNVFGQPVVLRDLADDRNQECRLVYDGLGRLVSKDAPRLYAKERDFGDFQVIDVGVTIPGYPDNGHTSVATVADAIATVRRPWSNGGRWLIRLGRDLDRMDIDVTAEETFDGFDIVVEGASNQQSPTTVKLLWVGALKATLTFRNIRTLDTHVLGTRNVTFDRCDIHCLHAFGFQGQSLHVRNSVLHDQGEDNGQPVVEGACVVLEEMGNSTAVFAHNVFDLTGSYPIKLVWGVDPNRAMSSSDVCAYNNVVVSDSGTYTEFINKYGTNGRALVNSRSPFSFSIARAAVPEYRSASALATCQHVSAKFAERGIADVPHFVNKQFGRVQTDKDGRLRDFKHPTPGPVEAPLPNRGDRVVYRYVYDGSQLAQRETKWSGTPRLDITRIIPSLPGRNGPTIFIDSDRTVDINLVDRQSTPVCLYRAMEGFHQFRPANEGDLGVSRNSGILRPPSLASGPFLDYPAFHMQVLEPDVLLGRQGFLGWNQIERDWTIKLAGPIPEEPEYSWFVKLGFMAEGATQWWNKLDFHDPATAWSFGIGVVLVIGGIALTIVTAGAASPILFLLASTVAGAAMGGGMALLANANNPGHRLSSLAEGAAIGAIGGLAGGGAMLGAARLAGTTVAAALRGGLLAQMAMGGSAGMAGGFAAGTATGLMQGKSWSDSLGMGITGGVMGGMLGVGLPLALGGIGLAVRGIRGAVGRIRYWNAMRDPAERSRIDALVEAFTASKGKAATPAEARGLWFTIDRVERLNYTLRGSIKYEANHGIDLWFEGVGRNSGKFALAEAKASRNLSSLEVDTVGLRQGGPAWFLARLQHASGLGVPNARMLETAFTNGRVEMFIGLARSQRLFQVNTKVWLHSMGDINFRKTRNALLLVP